MKIDSQKLSEIILKHHPNCQAIYLFGSFAAGQETKNSDVDIAVLLPHLESKEISSFAMSKTLNEIEMTLNRDVDLINLRAVSTVFQVQIINKGKLIFCADKNAKANFEMLSTSLYLKLNEERKEILNRILSR